MADSGRKNGNLEVNCGEKMEIAGLGYLSTKPIVVLLYSSVINQAAINKVAIKQTGTSYVKTYRLGRR